jgi:hypothetical protein
MQRRSTRTNGRIQGVATNLQFESTGTSALLSRVERSLQQALSFLEGRQLGSGEFPVLISLDRTMAKECSPDPSVFPTALIAHSLSFAASTDSLRERALNFLLAQMDHNGLWRHWTRNHPHCRELPPDLDDTCCASAVLSHNARRIASNRPLLLANRNGRGLFFTWIAPRPAWTGTAHMKVTFAQLRHALTLYYFFQRTSAALYDVDAVVNANSLFYLKEFSGRQIVADHLLDILREGSETACDKWYDNPFVIWYFFSRALHESAPQAGSIIQRRLAAAIATNALEAALAICSLAYWKCLAADTAVTHLLDAQLDSGAWPRAAFYHGGRTRRRDGSFAPPHPDTPHWGAEELTTAFCVEALAHWLQIRRS